MTKKIREQIRELEDAAEKAGGYVLPPWEVEYTEKGEREFIALRRYSLETGKPISKFTAEDYQKLGIAML